MAANWLRDIRNDHDTNVHRTGVVQCLLEEVENQLARSNDRRLSAIEAVDRQEQSAPPNYLWLTSAWSPTLTSVSGRGARGLSCRERCELEHLFSEVKGPQCCQVIREFRKQATEIKTAHEATSLMKNIVKAALRCQEVEIKTKKSFTTTIATTTIPADKSFEKIDDIPTEAPPGGGKHTLLRQRFRSIALALVFSPGSSKVAPDSDACPVRRRLSSWDEA